MDIKLLEEPLLQFGKGEYISAHEQVYISIMYLTLTT